MRQTTPSFSISPVISNLLKEKSHLRIIFLIQFFCICNTKNFKVFYILIFKKLMPKILYLSALAYLLIKLSFIYSNHSWHFSSTSRLTKQFKFIISLPLFPQYSIIKKKKTPQNHFRAVKRPLNPGSIIHISY